MRAIETTKLQTAQGVHVRFGVSMRLKLGGRSPACDRSAVLGSKILIRTEKVKELVRVHKPHQGVHEPVRGQPTRGVERVKVS